MQKGLHKDPTQPRVIVGPEFFYHILLFQLLFFIELIKLFNFFMNCPVHRFFYFILTQGLKKPCVKIKYF